MGVNRGKINKILNYVLFLFAFICCGFVFNSDRVGAAPVVSVSDVKRDDTGKATGLSIYVGYGTPVISSLKYTFDNSNYYTISNPDSSYNAVYKNDKGVCNSAGMSSCEEVIARYDVSLSGKNLNVSNNAFSVTVEASNKRTVMFIPLGGKTTATSSIVYDNKAPSISNVGIGRDDASSKTFFSIGEIIQFSLTLSEDSTVGQNVKVKFKIGDIEKKAICPASSTKTKTVTCTYTVLENDSGSITVTDIENSGNIKDGYGNGVSAGLPASSTTLSVDGVKPTIKSISVISGEGNYSSSKTVAIEVKLSEKIFASISSNDPYIKIKFGDGGTERVCNNYLFDNESTITFTCSPDSKDQGVLYVLGVYNNDKYHDEAGNTLNLSYKEEKFDRVKADNGLPEMISVKVDASACNVYNGIYYCTNGDQIKVSFGFNENVTIDQSTISIKFSDYVIDKSPSSRAYDETAKTLELTFIVTNRDKGILHLDYSIKFVGDNALSSAATDSKQYSNICADNDIPSVSLDGITVDGASASVTSNEIYTKVNGEIVFDFEIDEVSEIKYNPNKIYLVDEYDNKWYVGELCDVVSLESSLTNKILSVKLVLANKEFSGKFKVKMEKDAIEDSFGYVLANDYLSVLYIVDTKTPSFNVEVKMPRYKGMVQENGSLVLIGGNKVDIVLSSSDKDLVEYCVVNSENGECFEYEELALNNGKFTINQSFDKTTSGKYSLYIHVRDIAGNESVNAIEFNVVDMFKYSNGEGVTSKNHSITFDSSSFSAGTLLKYGWFKEGDSITFANAQVISKQEDEIVINGDSSYNGKYQVCVSDEANSSIFCSEYVYFDTKIDSFEVSSLDSWSNSSLVANITFNDSSSISCVAVSKNVSNVNCDTVGNDSVTIYRGANATSPINSYSVSENATYYFYIRDAVGNEKTISKTVTTIDKEGIKIDVYNGNEGENNTNLDVSTYKNNHKFLITFDKDVVDGSYHSIYRYFFTKSNVNLNSEDNFDYYYLNSAHKQETINNDKYIYIAAPITNGIWNLHIMAKDSAGNCSFASVNGIYVDAIGPSIKLYDSNNNEVSGGSSSYISAFNYTIVIEDKYSNLNLNNVGYKWVNSSNNVVLEQNYSGCIYGETSCTILGEDVSLNAVFLPTEKYRLVVTAYDTAGNMGEFISGQFMIDKTAPSIEIDAIEDKWRKNGNVSFTVSKDNSSTLDTIRYCLNDCLDGENYDLDKFTFVSFTGNTVVKELNLSLVNGSNVLYIYAADVFGNYAYKKATLKYDNVNPEIVVNGLGENNVVDLTGNKNLKLGFTASDSISKVSKYCVYLKDDEVNKVCVDNIDENEYVVNHSVSVNGEYVIEVFDYGENSNQVNVNVIGIDTEPIRFSLTTGLASNEFVKGTVTISIVNMRKFMVENVEDKVSTIDYVALDYNYAIVDYDSMFASLYNNVYTKGVHEVLNSSFTVSDNKQYLVRIVDTVGNISYESIKINCIDNDAPYIDVSQYPDKSERIVVTTQTGNNIKAFVSQDGQSTVYKYSNEIVKVRFGVDSLRDKSTGYNSYLGLKVCFDAEGCVYNTYNVSNNLVGEYLVNEQLEISAPYNFSGTIHYYLIDAANNASEEHVISVQYLYEVEPITGTLSDSSGNELIEGKQYNKINVSLDGVEVEDIVNKSGIKFALVASSSNLYTEFANTSSNAINAFLIKHNFTTIGNKNFEVTKENADGSYYLWIYVNDLLGNYKLMKIGNLVNVDTIVPDISEMAISIDRISNTQYDLNITNPNADYKLYIDINNTGSYEEITVNKYTFESGTYNYIKLKVVDEALNESNVVTYNLDDVQSNVYAKVYQEGNERVATLVIYNLSNLSSVGVQYIVTNINDSTEYDADDITSIDTCTGYEDTCKGTVTYSNSHGIYSLDLRSFNKDKKVIFYVRVDGVLLDLVQKNIVVDTIAPTVTFGSGNPSIISSVNGTSQFEVSIVENNLTNLNNMRYVLTTTAVISANSFDSVYNSCDSVSCARGVYSLNNTLSGEIVIDSISSKFSRLSTGTYYLHVYVEDDYGNARVGTSGYIYIDNTSPVLEYSTKNNQGEYQTYQNVVAAAYVGKAAKLRFTDNHNVKYFELYKSGELITTCYVDSAEGVSANCERNSSSEMGLVIEQGIAHYYLDTGNYTVKVYDYVNNYFEGVINVDGSDPIINLYKNGVDQNSSVKLYNSLENLSVSISDNNFNYLTIDLINTISGEIVNTAVRYSYNSSMGKCLTDLNECQYGANLLEMIVSNAIQYNMIVVNAYDKALRHSMIQISYDNIVPVIWVVDVGEKINVGGISYDVGEDHTLEFEIGTNSQLTLERLLEKVVLEVDGKTYSEIKNNGLFTKTIYKDGVVFDGDVFLNIGSYVVHLNYSDEAGNVAVSKAIKFTVNDTTKPEFIYDSSLDNVEVQEEINVNGIVARDNHGFNITNGIVNKEKTLLLSSGACKVVISEEEGLCDSKVVKISDTRYKFVAVGVYTFTYNISDLSGNSSTYVQTINVVDANGPSMSSSVDEKLEFTLKFRNRVNGELNIDNLVLKYPNSFDKGDGVERPVTYLGIYLENSHGQVYKVNDSYLVSNVNKVLTYKFDKVGKYYIRFSSMDTSGNMSIFNYTVLVKDEISPVITGNDISDNTTVEISIDDEFSAQSLINKYSIVAVDNYDSHVLISSKVNFIDSFNYEVILSARDSSNNKSSIKINVVLKDDVKPIVGELNLVDSTNENNVEFEITGGSDNSANWWHEYNIEGSVWSKFEEGSMLEFGDGLNGDFKVCVRAVDASNNISDKQSCKTISVDTKVPHVEGVSNGDISSTEITVNVSDEKLISVDVWLNNELLDLDMNSLPVTFDEIGTYRIVAKDSFDNETIVDFIIDINDSVGIVNDINSPEYSITSVEFDKRLLTKVEINYDNNGYASYSTKLDNIRVNSNDMLYVLGVVPDTDSKFVMFSVSGANIEDYYNGVGLIGGDVYFKEGVNNEDFFIKIGNDYYAYVLVKENENKDPVESVNSNTGAGRENKTLSTLLICVGSLTVMLIGYQVIKLRKKVRAA